MAFSRITFTGDGSTSVFAYPFDALDIAEVRVAVNSQTLDPADYTVTTNDVTLTDAPDNGAIVTIFRTTGMDDRIVNFQGASTLSPTALNNAFLQLFLGLQEAYDSLEALPDDDGNGGLDAGGKRLRNIAAGIDGTDAVTKDQLDQIASVLTGDVNTFLASLNGLTSRMDAVEALATGNANGLAGCYAYADNIQSAVTTLQNTMAVQIARIDALAAGEGDPGAGNTPPVATDVSATVDYNSTSNDIDVLANDSDDDDDDLIVSSVSNPSHGTVAIASDDLSVEYTPDTGYSGSDSFTYTVSDGNGGFDVGTVTITVSEAPANPDVTIVFSPASGVKVGDDVTATINGAGRIYIREVYNDVVTLTDDHNLDPNEEYVYEFTATGEGKITVEANPDYNGVDDTYLFAKVTVEPAEGEAPANSVTITTGDDPRAAALSLGSRGTVYVAAGSVIEGGFGDLGSKEISVIATGEGARPLFRCTGDFYRCYNGDGRIIRGVEAICVAKKPDEPEWDEDNVPYSAGGIVCMGECDDFLVEDCKIGYFGFNIVFQATGGTEKRHTNVRIIRNIIHNSWKHYDSGQGGGHSSGIYLEKMNGVTVRENFIYKNGYLDGVSGASPTKFNHGVYEQVGSLGVYIAQNFFVDNSAHGCQNRSGGVVEENCYFQCALAGFSVAQLDGSDTEVRRNLVLESKDLKPSATADDKLGTGFFALRSSYAGAVNYTENVLDINNGTGGKAALNSDGSSGGETSRVRLVNNRIGDWSPGADYNLNGTILENTGNQVDVDLPTYDFSTIVAANLARERGEWSVENHSTSGPLAVFGINA